MRGPADWYPHDMGQPFIEQSLRPFSKMIFWTTGGSNVTARAHFDPPHNFYAIVTVRPKAFAFISIALSKSSQNCTKYHLLISSASSSFSTVCSY